MADYEILNTSDAEKWNNLYSNLPEKMQSPFFTSQYYESYLEVEKGRLHFFWKIRI